VPLTVNQDFISARKALAKRLGLFLPEPEANAESWRWFDEGLGWGKARLIAHGDELVPETLDGQLDAWFDRRRRGEPWAYILGWTIWRSRPFFVTPATLIPRPETELVLESAMGLAEEMGARSIVDVGTGTGILGISLALETRLEVIATDISIEALDVARRNAHEHQVNLAWFCGDLLEAVPKKVDVDMVVSNPPYIDMEEGGTLQRELSFEPPHALFAADHGLEVVTRILKQGFERKAKGIVTEIGSGQGEALKLRAVEIGWRNVEIKQDTAGHDRVLVAILSQPSH
jgi:release factor glutamine methyltransferase